jgi:ectoine hydroxylase
MMRLSPSEVADYRRDGLLMLDSVFQPLEVKQLRDAFVRDCGVPGPHRILEADGASVRAIYASHLREPVFDALLHDSRVLLPVHQLLSTQVYVYQHKINAKLPFSSDKWSWHQDFPAWRIVDSLPAPHQINVGVFLDDVTEFNGPVVFVPGSHRDQLREVGRRRETSPQHLDPDDIALTATELASLVERKGMVAPKGPAGSVIFFSSEIVHGSAANISPFPRRLLIITYNDVQNQPSWDGQPRPEYLVGRAVEPLKPIHGGILGVSNMVAAPGRTE